MVRGQESFNQELVLNRCFSMSKSNPPPELLDKPKRIRERNYTLEETEILMQLIMERKYIITSKRTGAAAWREKECAWQAIKDEFNRRSVAVFRDTKSLKTKYDGLRREIKKKMNENQLDSPLTSVETAVYELIAISAEEEGDTGQNNTSTDIVTSSQSQVEYLNLDINPLQLSQYIKEEPNNGDDDMSREANSCHSSYEPPPLPNEDCGDPEIDKELKLKEEMPNTAHLLGTSHIKHESEDFSTKWNEKTHRSFTSSRSLGKPFQKRQGYERLIRAKRDIAVCKKKILEEELQTKMIQRQMAAEELEHKRELFTMEKMKLEIQIDLLKRDFDNSKYLNGIKR